MIIPLSNTLRFRKKGLNRKGFYDIISVLHKSNIFQQKVHFYLW